MADMSQGLTSSYLTPEKRKIKIAKDLSGGGLGAGKHGVRLADAVVLDFGCVLIWSGIRHCSFSTC